MKTWKSIFKSKQVRKECLYSFLILMGIRLLATIPTPGTNPDYFKTLIHDNSALTFIDAICKKYMDEIGLIDEPDYLELEYFG